MGIFKNVKEVSERVNLYLDYELSTSEEKEFIQQVKTDPACQEMLEKEEKFRRLIRTNVPRKTASPELIQAIKSKIKVG